MALFGNAEIEAEEKMKLFSKAQEDKRNELVETAKAINDCTKASIENAKSAEIQSDILRGYFDNLSELESNGTIKENLKQAQYYVDQINSSMPGTVELTEEGQLTWLKNKGAIEENIVALERKAKVEAYYDGYVESLKNETKLRGELTLAQNNYNAELEKQKQYQEEYNQLKEKYNEQGYLNHEDLELFEEYGEKLSESNERLSQYSETLDKAKVTYEANAKGAELYQQAVGALDGNLAASAQLQLEEYKVLEENGTSTWDSLAAASEDCKNRVETAQTEEQQVIEKTSELIQAEMINKALVQGQTYDDMIKNLEDAGMQMSDEEKKQLKNSYNQWKMNGQDIQNLQTQGLDTLKLMKSSALSDMSNDEKSKLADSVKTFAKYGSDEGIELCNQLAASLEANNGKVNEEVKNILEKIEKEAKEANPEVKIIADTSGALKGISHFVSNVQTSFNNLKINLPSVGKTKGYASGGFPETGELFIAREAGPELIGRINGKTAVANNDQIISGISSGVYNAVRSAIQSKGSGDMNIHATFVMDGEVIGKQVIKYHNGVVRRTGATPLML